MSELTLRLMADRNKKPTIFELGGEAVKPCPFCGCAEVYYEDDAGFLRVRCGTCGATGPCRATRVHAIQVWQRRIK